jgi:hypothetical protein
VQDFRYLAHRVPLIAPLKIVKIFCATANPNRAPKQQAQEMIAVLFWLPCFVG